MTTATLWVPAERSETSADRHSLSRFAFFPVHTSTLQAFHGVFRLRNKCPISSGNQRFTLFSSITEWLFVWTQGAWGKTKQEGKDWNMQCLHNNLNLHLKPLWGVAVSNPLLVALFESILSLKLACFDFPVVPYWIFWASIC